MEIVQPLEDRVLIRPPEKNEMTEGGLFVPQSVDDDAPVVKGVVVASGAGRHLDGGQFVENPVQVNDLVLYYKRSGLPIKVNGEELVLLGGQDVLALVREE